MKIVVSLTMQMMHHRQCRQCNRSNRILPVLRRRFIWFANNQMKANPGKCHVLLSTQVEANTQIVNTTIKCHKRLLGKILDIKLLIENIYQKASSKLNARARLKNYMELRKRCILMNAFFKA